MAPLPKTRLLCTLFKDTENYDRKGGCTFLLAWKLEQFIKGWPRDFIPTRSETRSPVSPVVMEFLRR